MSYYVLETKYRLRFVYKKKKKTIDYILTKAKRKQ